LLRRPRATEPEIVYLQSATETLSLSRVLQQMQQFAKARGSDVSETNSDGTPPSSLQWSSASRWWTVLALVVVVVAGFFAVRYLGGGAIRGPFADASIEENWDRTIKGLGVSPIFPPEEDLVVGDVLAVVTRDVDIDSHERTDAFARKAFVNRSVKLAHVDVSQALDVAYQNLPVFPATVGTILPLRSGVARTFSDAVLLANLPRAAFPRLKIQGVNNAAGAISAGGSGAASYAAGSQRIEEFELSDVRAYGLPSVVALQLFDAFCAKPETADVCQEATARKHLQRVVGDHVIQRFVDDRSGDYRYALEVEIVMVYRVYLTGSITDMRRTEDNKKGGLMALWPFGSSQSAPAATVAVPASAPAAGDTAAQIQALNDKLAEVERKLAGVKNGGAVNYESFFGNESSLEGKFERPVAIGYRGVKHDFPSDKPAPK
jgi:hypothetical protein